MDCTVDDTLSYVLFLTRHIRRGDVPAAVLALLMEMSFQSHIDGFWQLRDAIVLKHTHYHLRYGEIYTEVGKRYGVGTGSKQVEQTIRDAISAAWDDKNEETWGYFFSDKRTGELVKPSNSVFIGQMASIMVLWCSSCKEGCYAAKG